MSLEFISVAPAVHIILQFAFFTQYYVVEIYAMLGHFHNNTFEGLPGVLIQCPAECVVFLGFCSYNKHCKGLLLFFEVRITFALFWEIISKFPGPFPLSSMHCSFSIPLSLLLLTSGMGALKEAGYLALGRDFMGVCICKVIELYV